MPGSAIVGHTVDLFPGFLRNYHTVFHSGCINATLFIGTVRFPVHHILANIHCFLFSLSLLISD